MTIHQLDHHCWATNPASLHGDDERQPHYVSEADSKRAITEAREENPDLRATARQLDSPCWQVACDGECEQVIDEEDEGYIVHCESLKAAEELARAWRWAYSADGRQVFCEEDAPADGVVSPASPAELEAAGQMRLPGVA